MTCFPMFATFSEHIFVLSVIDLVWREQLEKILLHFLKRVVAVCDALHRSVRRALHQVQQESGTTSPTFLKHAQSTKSRSLSTVMCSEGFANDGKWVIQTPKVAILDR